jgi:hypothetical protein
MQQKMQGASAVHALANLKLVLNQYYKESGQVFGALTEFL